MGRETLNLKQAAEHIHVDPNELRHVAQRGEIEATEHGGDWWFEHRALDEWAQRNLLAATKREQVRQHNAILEENRRAHHDHQSRDDRHVPHAVSVAIHSLSPCAHRVHAR